LTERLRNRPMRSSRRASPQKTKNSGATPIQGISGINAAMAARACGSLNRISDAC
jgi:hypothetical protein